MKKTTTALLIALFIALLIGFGDAGMEQHPHICTDLSHATCDGECGCDGLECDTPRVKPEYKIELRQDRAIIESEDGHVFECPVDSISAAITQDNL